MGPDTIRWTLSINRRTDLALRMWLARAGLRKGDLSRFVEDAVLARLAQLQSAADPDPQAMVDRTGVHERKPDAGGDPELQSALEEWRHG